MKDYECVLPLCYPTQKLIKTLSFLCVETQGLCERNCCMGKKLTKIIWCVKLNKWGCEITLKQMHWIRGGAGHTRPKHRLIKLD